MNKLILLFFIATTYSNLTYASEIKNIDILVYDSSENGTCFPRPTKGCIRMKVNINNGEEIHEWIANSGGKGYKKCRAEWANCLKGREFFYFEGNYTPNYKNRLLGTQYGKNYRSARYQLSLPYLIKIQSSAGKDSGVGIFGNDNVIGNTNHTFHISVSMDNMKQLSSWVAEAKANNGSRTITVTVPRID